MRRSLDTSSFARSCKSKSLWRDVVSTSLNKVELFLLIFIVSFTKFTIFVEFAAFRIPPLPPAASNLILFSEMSSNRQFSQICDFRRIRRFTDTPLFRSLSPI